MDWLRLSTPGVQRSRTSRAVVSDPLTLAGGPLSGAQHHFSPVCPVHSDAKPFGTIRTLVREVASRPLTPLSCVPWLHGRYPLPSYYGRSDPDRPFRRRQPWFPDSRHHDFQPFHLQPSTVLRQPRPLPLRWQLYFVRASSFSSRLARTADRIEFTLSQCLGTLLRTGRSLPVALHPGVSPRCSYVQLLALQCRPGQGLSPCCLDALSGALERLALRAVAPRRAARQGGPEGACMPFVPPALRGLVGSQRDHRSGRRSTAAPPKVGLRCAQPAFRSQRDPTHHLGLMGLF